MATSAQMRDAGHGFACDDRSCVGPDGARFCRHHVEPNGTTATPVAITSTARGAAP